MAIRDYDANSPYLGHRLEPVVPMDHFTSACCLVRATTTYLSNIKKHKDGVYLSKNLGATSARRLNAVANDTREDLEVIEGVNACHLVK